MVQASVDFNRSETASIKRKDLAALVACFSEDKKQIDNDTIANNFSEAINVLEYGFRLEQDKGALYVALHHCLGAVRDSVISAPSSADAIDIRCELLELINASHCQLAEAALQMAGSVKGKGSNPILDQCLPNNGEGHASEERKHQADLLRTVTARFTDFFNKYPIKEASNDTIDFFAERPPNQALNA